VRDGHTQKMADKMGWPVNWWPTLGVARRAPTSVLAPARLRKNSIFYDYVCVRATLQLSKRVDSGDTIGQLIGRGHNSGGMTPGSHIRQPDYIHS
jgi:hypothetical protein